MLRAGKLAIALAGGIGSGKSTVAQWLAAEVGGNVLSFGDYIRHLANTLGEPTNRLSLQRIGQKQVEAGASNFLSAFLSWASPDLGSPLIIDGVRHIAVHDALREWALRSNIDYALIAINTPAQTRAERRHDGDLDETNKVDSHPVEQEAIARLPEFADLVVDGSGSIEDVIHRIFACAPDPLARLLR